MATLLLLLQIIFSIALIPCSLLPLLILYLGAKLCARCTTFRRYVHGTTQHLTTPRFTYTQLSSQQSIRLLTVLPGKRLETLHCTLSEVDLLERPTYTALSYVWSIHGLLYSFFWRLTFMLAYFPWSLCAHLAARVLPSSLLDSYGHLMSIYASEQLGTIVYRLEHGTFEARLKLIICNGRRLYIRKNLHDFLLQVRENGDDTKYWIDAVSINQSDLLERGQQVALMKTIYCSAERTLSWLGTCPLLLDQSETIENSHLPIDWSALESNDMHSATKAYIALRPLARLYIVSLKYFSRAWIVQECAVPRELVFMLGRHHLSADMMLEVARLNTVGTLAMLAEYLAMLTPGSSKKVLAILERRKDYQQRGSWTLSEYLSAAAGRHASDGRDTIYAGLGMVKLTVSPSMIDIRVHSDDPQVLEQMSNYTLDVQLHPDYSRTAVHVFEACGLRLLLESGMSGLSHGCDGSCTTLADHGYIPSWAPHLFEDRAQMLHRSESFRAGGVVRAEIRLRLDKCLVLATGARRVDTIATVRGVSVVSLPKIILALYYELPKLYTHTRELLITAIARTVVADCVDQEHGIADLTDHLIAALKAHLARELEFTQSWVSTRATVVAKSQGIHDISKVIPTSSADVVSRLQARHDIFASRVRSEREVHDNEHSSTTSSCDDKNVQDVTHETGPDFSSDVQDLNSGWLLTCIAARNKTRTPYEQAMEECMRNRQLFTTEQGYIGIGSPHLKAGDEIMVLAGASVPYAMHRVEDEGLRYHMCGEVYVHGVMNGEMMARDDLPWLQLVIE